MRFSRASQIFALIVSVGVVSVATGYGFAFAQSDDGYEGVIAPSKPAKKDPSGYAGVIPGYVAPPEQEEEAPPTETESTAVVDEEPQQSEMPTTRRKKSPPPLIDMHEGVDVTKVPGTDIPRRALTVEELNVFANLRNFDRNGNGVFDSLEGQRKLGNLDQLTLGSPRTRVEGMLPAEMMAKDDVEAFMTGLSSQNLSPEQRKAYARSAYVKLDDDARGTRFLLAIPDETYENSNTPKLYVQEEREQYTKALQHYDAALEYLEKML